MIQTPEPLVQFGTSNIEAVLTVADITLRSAERLLDLQLKTAKEALAEGVRNAQAISDAKNVQDIVALQSRAAQPSLEKALAYSRDVYAVASDAQARIGKVLETCMSELSTEIMTAMDQAAKTAPGSDAALAAFKSAFAAANNATERRAPERARKIAPGNGKSTKSKKSAKKSH